MKTSITNLIHKSVLTGALLALTTAQAPEARASSIGFANTTFQPGANLFGNPLNASVNDLNTLFPTAPDGTVISLWDASSLQFSQSSVFAAGGWSMNLTLAPGTGAALTTPGLFTQTFVGEVLNASGGPLTGIGSGIDIRPPAPFGGADGLYLFSSLLPVTYPFTSSADSSPPNTTFNAFDLIVGRAATAGESVTRLDRTTQTYFTTTFDGVDWDNGAPGLAIGEAAFFNIGPVTVPEPSTLGLCMFGILGLLGVRFWRRKREC
jgi:hypothetical protein